METAADQLEADVVTIATITAERDAAQDRAYSLAVAIMGGEDAPGLADSLPTETLEILARSNFRRHSEDIDRLTAAQAEIARLTAALATARGDGMRESANILQDGCEKCGGAGWLWGHEKDCPPEVDQYPDDTKYSCDGASCSHASTIAAAIQKGAAT